MSQHLNLSERCSPVRFFADYVGLKLHFSGDFVWKPDSMKRITQDTLNSRKDAWRFSALAKTFDCREESVNFLVSAFMFKPDFYIIDWENEDLQEYHASRMKRCANILHLFELEMEAITEYVESSGIEISDLLGIAKKPGIIRDQRKIIGGVSIETLAILDHFFGFCTQTKTADPLWKEQAFKISRYKYLCRPQSPEVELYKRHILNLLKTTQSTQGLK